MNRYTYQFNASFKPRMAQIEGFVSVGTGGLPNAATASGTVYGLLPGNTVLGTPTGWVGGFSGTVGLYGAGVASVARQATGTYAVLLSDDYVRLDSVQVQAVGATGVDATVLKHTVGLGNSTAAKNVITIAFASSSTGQGVDLPSGAGFFLDVRVRDSSAGPQ